MQDWVPKIDNSKLLGRSIFLVWTQYIEITTIGMHLLIEIRHWVLTQWHGNYIEMNNSNCMPKIDILRNYSLKFMGVLRGDFWGFWCPKDTQTSWGVIFEGLGVQKSPDALLAETMLRAASWARQAASRAILGWSTSPSRLFWLSAEFRAGWKPDYVDPLFFCFITKQKLQGDITKLNV